MDQIDPFFEYYGRALTKVRWDYLSASGESMQQTRFHNLLRENPDGKLKTQVVIAHPES